ncbi:chaplin [Streptomyces poriticola]|uniref:chaplin n=1 Tax=Streptomyces poriticola TaxID=3120506 RepID=UPI002FCE3118
MRQVTRKGLMTVAAATGVIAAAGGTAHAGSGAHGSGSGSPGVLSGNTVQAPVDVPVNVCGNTVNVVGVLNPSIGNACANTGGGAHGGNGHSGGHGAHGGSHAGGHATDSPGIGSGNHVQAPVHVPVNVCGNSVDVIGVANATTGNDCANPGGGHGHRTDPPGSGNETPPGTPGNPDDPGNPGNPGESGNPGDSGSPDGSDGQDDRDDRDDQGGTGGQDGQNGQDGQDGQGGASSGASADGNRTGVHAVSQSQDAAALARTGSDLPLGLTLPVGAGALLAGAVLYRKARASA